MAGENDGLALRRRDIGDFRDPAQANPQDIQRWNYDDSRFTTLLIHRLPDALSREAEGAAIAVSSRRR